MPPLGVLGQPAVNAQPVGCPTPKRTAVPAGAQGAYPSRASQRLVRSGLAVQGEKTQPRTRADQK